MPNGSVLARLRYVLALLPTAVLAVFATGDFLPVGTAGSLALASAVTAGLVLLVVVAAVQLQPTSSSLPARSRAVTLRECAKHTVFLRLRDPDARGRIRSRAPSPA
ncbi:MAG: DUF6412 domain-containing protein [Actinomycetota bacterium]|nr:DUF6412 domain-containing protein [Actinomycetota bacterium]